MPAMLQCCCTYSIYSMHCCLGACNRYSEGLRCHVVPCTLCLHDKLTCERGQWGCDNPPDAVPGAALAAVAADPTDATAACSKQKVHDGDISMSAASRGDQCKALGCASMHSPAHFSAYMSALSLGDIFPLYMYLFAGEQCAT